MIAHVSRSQALAIVANTLSVGEVGDSPELSDTLLAQAVRRAATVMAPCATYELVRAVAGSFSALSLDHEELSNRIDKIVEDLVVYGDILEMREVSDDIPIDRSKFLLRPAPPCFVPRRNGTIAIVGIAGDQLNPLTGDLAARMNHQGVLRSLGRTDDEQIESTLTDLGLFRLPERTWLRLPTVETANEHVARWEAVLAKEPVSGAVSGLQVLDTAEPTSFYKGRWTSVDRSQNGSYIARRPQKYGAPLWCVVQLQNGNIQRFKDLSIVGDRLRPVDIAWRLQAALDAVAGRPQHFKIDATDASAVIKFFSPIPSWCERYLSIDGLKIKADRCLFGFQTSVDQVEDVQRFLREMLWMTESSNPISGMK